VIYYTTTRTDGSEYDRILRMCRKFATLAGLMVDSPDHFASGFLESIDKFVVREEPVGDSPAGRCPTPTRRLICTYDDEFIEVIEGFSSGLLSWHGPQLPADLHLLRPDGSTVLGTVVAEYHVYLELTDREAAEWLREWPHSLIAQDVWDAGAPL